jgi:hypothetical protein
VRGWVGGIDNIPGRSGCLNSDAKPKAVNLLGIVAGINKNVCITHRHPVHGYPTSLPEGNEI